MKDLDWSEQGLTSHSTHFRSWKKIRDAWTERFNLVNALHSHRKKTTQSDKNKQKFFGLLVVLVKDIWIFRRVDFTVLY